MSLEKIINWNEVSEDTRVDLLERPTRVIREDQNEIIEKIFAAVMSQGDKKLREYTKAFDNVEIDSIEMTDQEIHESLDLSSLLNRFRHYQKPLCTLLTFYHLDSSLQQIFFR